MTAEPMKVLVIMIIAIINIFNPCRLKSWKLAPMEIPANAPTIESGALNSILSAASVTKPDIGEAGMANKSPNNEQNKIIGKFIGTTLEINTAINEITANTTKPIIDSVTGTLYATKFVVIIAIHTNESKNIHSLYFITDTLFLLHLLCVFSSKSRF